MIIIIIEIPVYSDKHDDEDSNLQRSKLNNNDDDYENENKRTLLCILYKYKDFLRDRERGNGSYHVWKQQQQRDEYTK